MDSPSVPARTSAFERWLFHSLLAVALCLWFGTIMLLFVRLLVSADLRPLSGPALLAAGVVMSAVALLTRWVWPVRVNGFWPAHGLRIALPLTAMILMGLLLCQRVTNVPTLFGFWLIVGLCELATLAYLANWRYQNWQQRRTVTEENATNLTPADPAAAIEVAVPAVAKDGTDVQRPAASALEPDPFANPLEAGADPLAEPAGARGDPTADALRSA